MYGGFVKGRIREVALNTLSLINASACMSLISGMILPLFFNQKLLLFLSVYKWSRNSVFVIFLLINRGFCKAVLFRKELGGACATKTLGPVLRKVVITLSTG